MVQGWYVSKLVEQDSVCCGENQAQNKKKMSVAGMASFSAWIAFLDITSHAQNA